MRTLESVCPEMSRSEQYLSPPAHDREYGLANKQCCSSETSNGTCKTFKYAKVVCDSRNPRPFDFR